MRALHLSVFPMLIWRKARKGSTLAEWRGFRTLQLCVNETHAAGGRGETKTGRITPADRRDWRSAHGQPRGSCVDRVPNLDCGGDGVATLHSTVPTTDIADWGNADGTT